jgi:hypothetical protein
VATARSRPAVVPGASEVSPLRRAISNARPSWSRPGSAVDHLRDGDEHDVSHDAARPSDEVSAGPTATDHGGEIRGSHGCADASRSAS